MDKWTRKGQSGSCICLSCGNTNTKEALVCGCGEPIMSLSEINRPLTAVEKVNLRAIETGIVIYIPAA